MNKEEILDREIRALGQYYRNDWSDFDGRTLRYELERIMDWFKSESSDFTRFSEMLKEQENI